MSYEDALTEQGFVREYSLDGGRMEAWNYDGVPWHKARKPFRLHLCSPQTVGWLSWIERVDRCACGGVRTIRFRRWFNRNERRRG